MQQIPEMLASIFLEANIIKENNNPHDALIFLKKINTFKENLDKALKEVKDAIGNIAQPLLSESNKTAIQINQEIKNSFADDFLRIIEGVFERIKKWETDKSSDFVAWATEFAKKELTNEQKDFIGRKLNHCIEPENLPHATNYLDKYYTALKNQSLFVMIERLPKIAKKIGSPEYQSLVLQLETEITKKIQSNIKI
jgi:hypothetical protein